MLIFVSGLLQAQLTTKHFLMLYLILESFEPPPPRQVEKSEGLGQMSECDVAKIFCEQE